MSSAPEPTCGTVCLFFYGILLLWGLTALPTPPQCVLKGFCKVSSMENFSASSSVRKNATNLFCVPTLGEGQEDEGDHRGERALI